MKYYCKNKNIQCDINFPVWDGAEDGDGDKTEEEARAHLKELQKIKIPKLLEIKQQIEECLKEYNDGL